MPINAHIFILFFSQFFSLKISSIIIFLSMAPKKSMQVPSSSTSQEPSSKKDKHRRPHSPHSYSREELKTRISQFQKRSFVPSRFMHESTLTKLGCLDEVNNLLSNVCLLSYPFTPLPSYQSLIVEFLSSYTLRSANFDQANPSFSMRFKLGGRDRFMTCQEFDCLFGFNQEGHMQVSPHWIASNFWKQIAIPQAPHFSAGHTKASYIKNKALWYVHRFLTYSINGRALSNESISLDDLFILYCMVNKEPIQLGRFVQWRLWLISDSVTGAICVGGIVTKLAQYFGVDLDALHPTKPILLDDTFLKHSKQFTSINEAWVWKHDLGESEHIDALFQHIDEFEAQEEEQAPQSAHQRKRTRQEGTSQDPQFVEDEPPWVGQLFNRMSLMESNFNSRFDQLDANIAHLQHDVHYLYEQQGYSCSYGHPPPPPPPPNQD